MNLHNDKERFREAIIAASTMFGIEPSLVEKDYFVTLFLKESIKRIPGLVFKGRSGSGKSTLFKLAYGLIKPTSGRVTINGVDTYLLSDDVKRKFFGIVYQDYYFSGGSIKEEVTLLNKDISDEKVYETLKLVGLDRITDISIPLKTSNYSTGELSLFNIVLLSVFLCIPDESKFI